MKRKPKPRVGFQKMTHAQRQKLGQQGGRTPHVIGRRARKKKRR